jgi:aspartyl-tRNA(Asn)/glutamyl-tRNA(Gln) amidotransferase subunit A
MLNEIIDLSITQISEKIRNREISPIDLVNLTFERIKRIEDKINSYITLLPKEAGRSAKIAEDEIRKGTYRGSLHGIPIGIKDIIDTAGIPTTYGSKIFRNNLPRLDANVVERLKKAGAVIIGKTNTNEFALGATTNNPHYGATRNPWSLELIPGGSSGGSAAATVAGLCFAALGTDTGGSVRTPAAFCGLVGLKPTYGRISLRGVHPLSISLDHVGPLTRTVHDAAILLQYLAGYDKDDPLSLKDPVPDYITNKETDLEKIRIGISGEIDQIKLDPDIESSFNAATTLVEKFGAEIIELDLVKTEKIQNVSRHVLLPEAINQHSENLEKFSDQYGLDVYERLNSGKMITLNQYINAVREKNSITRILENFFKEVEFLLYPSTQILPSKIGEETLTLESETINVLSGSSRFTRLANLTGMPSIVIPFGYSKNSLPLSIQLIAPKHHEPQLLELAAKIEEATPNLRNRTPKIHSK